MVIARRTFRCRAWDLGAALDWAAGRAAAKGWAGVTASCEPTGHRWRVLGQLAADRPVPFVCVQPMVTSWSRRTEDLTWDKTDEKDAVLIARLTAQLRCYVPEPVDQTWGRLRHLGARREQLITGAGSQIQQMRDLLECVWPAALDTARQPFRSHTWMAAAAGDHQPRPGRGDHAPGRRTGAGAAAAGGLAAHQDPAHPGRAADDRSPGRARADRTGHFDHRPITRGCRGDPGRNRRPKAVRHRTGAGRARRPGPAGETVRRLHRPDLADRAGTPRAAPGSPVWGARRANPSTAPATST
jgi:Transposase